MTTLHPFHLHLILHRLHISNAICPRKQILCNIDTISHCLNIGIGHMDIPLYFPDVFIKLVIHPNLHVEGIKVGEYLFRKLFRVYVYGSLIE